MQLYHVICPLVFLKRVYYFLFKRIVFSVGFFLQCRQRLVSYHQQSGYLSTKSLIYSTYSLLEYLLHAV